MLVKMSSLLHGVRGIDDNVQPMKVLIGPTHLYLLNFLKSSQYRKRFATMLLFSNHEILKQVCVYKVCVYKNLDLSFGFSLHQRQILVQKYVANSKAFIIYCALGPSDTIQHLPMLVRLYIAN